MKAEGLFHTGEHFNQLGIIAVPGAEYLAKEIDQWLVAWSLGGPEERKTFLIDAECPRFHSGDAKALLKNSVRGMDIYLVADIYNYSDTYELFGHMNHYSPDDRFADLKRIIQAISGNANRLTVIMPQLYGGRQHKRQARESLDAACALIELRNMGINNVVCFDAHDPRVQNAVPLMGFDNYMPHYQVLKTLLNNHPELNISKKDFMIVSPDEGAMNRNMYYASVLQTDLGMFYKRRDYSRIENGRNPIAAHEYLGSPIRRKTIFTADDMIASGESILDIAKYMYDHGARRFFASATYCLFTSGYEAFDQAYKKGLIHGVLGTNLTYIPEALKKKPWFLEVDCSKYIACIIASLNHELPVSKILNPHSRIMKRLEQHNAFVDEQAEDEFETQLYRFWQKPRLFRKNISAGCTNLNRRIK